MRFRKPAAMCVAVVIGTAVSVHAQGDRPLAQAAQSGIAVFQPVICPPPHQPSGNVSGDMIGDASAAFAVTAQGGVEPSSIEIDSEQDWMESAVVDMLSQCMLRPEMALGQPETQNLTISVSYRNRSYRYGFTSDASRKETGGADEDANPALREIGEWLSTALPEFGTFSIGLRQDAGGFFSDLVHAAIVTARHSISEVSLQSCELQFTSQMLFQEANMAPLRWQITLPLRSIDVPDIRVQAYQTSYGFRTSGVGSEVYLEAKESSAGFPVWSTHVGTEVWYRLGLPLGRPTNAEQVADAIVRAAGFCGAN